MKKVARSVVLLFLMVFQFSFANEEISTNPIDQEKFKIIAKKIFKAQQLAPEKYSYSSNLSLGLYFIRYLGEIGKFKLHQKDINQLILGIESLYGEPLNATLKTLLAGIKVAHFSQNKTTYKITIRTIDSKQIKVPIDVKREGPISSINDFYIEDKASIVIWDMASKKSKRKYTNLLTKKIQFFTLPKIHLISKEYISGLKSYIKTTPEVMPIVGKVKKMGFNVSLKHWVIGSKKTINVKVDQVGSFIGLKDDVNNEDLPPFWLTAKKWGLRIVTTIDD